MKKTLLTGVAMLLLVSGAHAADPHFYPEVTIGGIPIRMMADTGATYVSLSFDDAKRIGLNPDTMPKNGRADTANGTKSISVFVLSEITVVGIVLHDVTASCCTTGESLLGMSALSRLNISFIEGKQIKIGVPIPKNVEKLCPDKNARCKIRDNPEFYEDIR